MTIHVTMVGDGAEDELRSYYRWLLAEDEIRQHARVALEGATLDDGDMGATVEAIQLVTDYGFQVGSLALSFFAYRATRPQKFKAVIEREGTRVLFSEDMDQAEMVRIIRALDPGEQ